MRKKNCNIIAKKIQNISYNNVMTIWKITIHLVFERSIDEDVKDFKSKADYNKFLNEEYAKEPNPTQKQLDAYMR